ncbi:hypothetical protein ACEQ8H_007917 [Pleosporales sp. CAS-2024a]
MLMAKESPTTVVVVTAVMLSLDIMAVALRFAARSQKRQSLRADDWFCLIALLLSFGLATTLFIGVAQKALAYPTSVAAPPLDRPTALDTSNEKTMILQYIFLVISVPTLGAIKISVVCFYRRIFVVDKSNLKDVTNAIYLCALAIIGLWTGGFCFALMFACKGHFTAWWTPAVDLLTKCVHTVELVFAFVVSDFLSDCIILILPIPMIWELHLPLSRKIGVLFVFLLGIMATVASLMRMIWVFWARIAGFDASLDQDLLITTSLFLYMLEASLGIIAACLPALRGLARTISVASLMNGIRDRVSTRSGVSSGKRETSIQISDSQKETSQPFPSSVTYASHDNV